MLILLSSGTFSCQVCWISLGVLPPNDSLGVKIIDVYWICYIIEESICDSDQIQSSRSSHHKTLVDPLHPLTNILLGSQGYRHTHLVSASPSPVVS